MAQQSDDAIRYCVVTGEKTRVEPSTTYPTRGEAEQAVSRWFRNFPNSSFKVRPV